MSASIMKTLNCAAIAALLAVSTAAGVAEPFGTLNAMNNFENNHVIDQKNFVIGQEDHHQHH